MSPTLLVVALIPGFLGVDPAIADAFVRDPGARIAVFVLLDDRPADLSFEEQCQRVSVLQDRVLADLAPHEFTLGYRYRTFAAFAGRLGASGYETLAHHPAVRTIGLDARDHVLDLAESVPYLGADLVIDDLGITGDDITVAVLDTGVQSDHPDLVDDLAPGAWHFLDQGDDTGPGAEDEFLTIMGQTVPGHGTGVAGVITSAGCIAPRGVAPDTDILAIKVIDQFGNTFPSDVAAGIDYVVSIHDDYDHLVALNMSFSSSFFSTECPCDTASTVAELYHEALTAARDVGIASFTSAGNAGFCGQQKPPQCLSSTIAVARVRDTGTSIDHLDGSDQLSGCNGVAASGYSVFTCALIGVADFFSGTSFSCPHAVGVAALMHQKALLDGVTLTPDLLESILVETGRTAVPDCDEQPQPVIIDAFACVETVGQPSSQCFGETTTVIDSVLHPTNGTIYHLLESSCWETAHARALQMNGHLADIATAEENDWLLQTFALPGGAARNLWIGLTDLETEGVFTWISGSPVTYENWGIGQPDGGSDESYVALRGDLDGEWTDEPDEGTGGLSFFGVVEVTTLDFVRGDVDGDGQFLIADPLVLLTWAFASGPQPACLDAADFDDSGQIEGIADALGLLGFLFGPGSPAPPYPDCGSDPTPDTLSCTGSSCP